MKKNHQKKFHEVMEQYTDSSKSKRLFKKAESLYLMRSFKISGISSQQAIQSYDRLFNKYEARELETLLNDWHKNERKLFIWFLICYCEERKQSIQDLVNLFLVQDEGEWIQMAHIFFNKSVLFLKFQGLSILKNTKRHNWVPQDDELLKKYVGQIGSNEWNAISKSIFFLKESGKFISPKQCRERWFNHICGEINKSQWSKEQDLNLLKLSLELGKKWSAIARSLNTNRTQHMVKNRYNSIINKVRRKKIENEESLARKAISLLEQKESFESDQNQREQRNEQSQKQSTLNKQKNQIDSKNSHKQSQEQGDEYNLNFLPQGQLKDLKQLVNKRQKGFIAFNAEEGFAGSQYIETNPSFSMTPSVKAISPGFQTHFYSFEGYFRNNEKCRQDGSSLFSPAPPCYSPAPNYFASFSPSFDFVSRLDRGRQKQQKFPSKDLQTPILTSQLSCEYKNIMNIKKQNNQ